MATVPTGSVLPELSAADRQALLRTAREALSAHLQGRAAPPPPRTSPVLQQRYATFVTLRCKGTGELRGCRGETRARQTLVESVREMVVASGVGDPRFEAVRAGEVEDLTIAISVLSPMWPIQPQEVEVGRHGLMIVRGLQAGLLLPSVPVSCGWDREQFLAGLCLKAGLPEFAWREDGTELLAFETATWGDGDDD